MKLFARTTVGSLPARLGVVGVGAILVVIFSAATYARDGRWGEVKDPHFGEVLFYFYQQKYFSAITHLTAAQAEQRVEHHRDEAELLRGGMYLSYGLHREAGKIFQRLIDEGVPPGVRDRAWFYLAKIWYQRGYLEQAVEALSRIQQALPGDLQEERQVLAALLLMKREKFKEAVKVLGRFSGRSEWAPYARYNMGVALVKIGEENDGVKLLEDIGGMRADNNEMRALRDKANLALGYTFLGLGGPERAKSYLEDVRLKGPFSNKALLGMGWALSARGQYKKSLVSWMELQSRNPIDVAVQESLLAVPYALRQLNAAKQSLQNYEAATSVYNAEIVRLGHTIESVRAGKLLIADLLEGPATETGWFWRLKRLSDTPENRYLVPLLASHEFHEALKNYRDLAFLSTNLSQWLTNIDAFDAMLETRRKGYEERLPRIIQKYNALDLAALMERRDDYAERLAVIVGQHNAMALANTEERRLLATLDRVNARIERISDDTDVADYRAKHKFFSGLLFWRISTDYKPRLRRAKKAIQELDDALVQAESRQQSLQAAQKYARKGFEGYQSRITALRRRLRKLERQAETVIRDHQHYLQELAVAALEDQKKRLRAYITQARFGIAQIYDSSVSRAEGKQPPTREEKRMELYASDPVPGAKTTDVQRRERQSSAAEQEITPPNLLALRKGGALTREGPPQPGGLTAAHASATQLGTNIASINSGPPKQPVSGITKRELSNMLSIFVADYRTGDLNSFMSLFAKEARTNERANRDDIRKDYEDLFRTTNMREMALRDVTWELKSNGALGWGNFEVKIQRTGERQVRTYTGSLSFQVEKQGKGIRITRLYHSQNRLKLKGNETSP